MAPKQKIPFTTKGIRTKALNPEFYFEDVHSKLDDALRSAMGDATTGSKYFTDIRRRQYVRERVAEYLKRGQQKEALEYLEYTKKQYGI